MRVNDTLTPVNCRNVSEISSFYFFEINLFIILYVMITVQDW
jgi:hypothetical protein